MSDDNVTVRVNLLPRVWCECEDTALLLGLRNTDVINRAITLYCRLEMERRAAGTDIGLIHEDGTVDIMSFGDDPPEIKERIQARRAPSLRQRLRRRFR